MIERTLARPVRRDSCEPNHWIRIAVAGLSAVLVGCSSRAPARTGAAPSQGRADAASLVAVATGSADAKAALDPAIAKCLGSGELRAVVTVASGTPDCSGVGHEQLVFDVVHLPGAGPAIKKAYLSCPLGVGCSQLGEAPAKDGSVWVALLKSDPRPARTVYCVPVPATQASIACAVPVESVERGRELIDAR